MTAYYGTDGDDYVSQSKLNGYNQVYLLGGNDQLTLSSPTIGYLIDGGAGDDTIQVYHASGAYATTLIGGDGNDSIFFGGSTAIIDAGAGDDTVTLSDFVDGSVQVTLGPGRDTLIPGYIDGVGPSQKITDFAPGSAGDRIDVVTLIGTNFTVDGDNWDGMTNPFHSHQLVAQQVGADVIISIDPSQGKDPSSIFADLTLQNVSLSSLTKENYFGYDPNGEYPSGSTITGGGASETLTGTLGDDVISGLAGDDKINGGPGRDLVYGGDGNDTLDGGYGDDIVHGGDGADILHETTSGNDSLLGENGNDILYELIAPGKTAILDGGADNDVITATSYALYAPAHASIYGGTGDDTINFSANDGIIDAGDGNDKVTLSGVGYDALTGVPAVQVTLGNGADTLALSDTYAEGLYYHVVVTDFTVGANGDCFDFTAFLQSQSSWDGSSNPFATGLLRLVQEGPDTLVQFESAGAGGATYVNLVDLKGVNASALTTYNLAGFASTATHFTAPNFDSDGDGGDNLLFHNVATGQFVTWFNGDSRQTVVLGGAGSNVDIATGDINGDGLGDILLHDRNSGSLVVWSGGEASQSHSLGGVGDEWTILTGDFDGDEKTDLLFHNKDDGRYVVWTGGDSSTAHQIGAAGNEWTNLVGDFNGDGKADLLLRNMNNGALIIWNGADGSTSHVVGGAGSEWDLFVGDFDGDAKSDLLFHNLQSGALVIWNGADPSTSHDIGAVGTDWTITTGDLNGDGKSDIIFHNVNDGRIVAWNGGDSYTSHTLGGAGAEWQLFG